MAIYAGIEKPISTEHPCGPDPDADAEIQNFLAVAEGQLPASYRDFNKKSFEAKQALQSLRSYLDRSRDIRLLVLAAKYHVLSDDLAGFAEAIAATNALLSQNWDRCHPTEPAGGPLLRSAYLKSLDDLPTSVLPLQNVTLVIDKRLGAIAMRSILVASKKLPPRDGETALDETSIRDAFLRVEPLEHLVDVQNKLKLIVASLSDLRQLFIDKAGYEAAPQFDQLPELAQVIIGYVGEIIATRSPMAEPDSATAGADRDKDQEATDGASPPTSGMPATIGSVKEASNALVTILGYYGASEPSSPARLLLKQAHQLVGKSFIDAMKILAPGMVEKAKIQIGGDTPFALNFAQLSALAVDEGKPAGAEQEAARNFTATTRAEATTLMRNVEQFYRSTEPSSPIPLLVERARNLVAKDFTELLKEMAKKDDKP